MRLLLVTDGIYPFVMGGMQKHSYYLAKFLSAKGVKVDVVHCAQPGVAGHELEHAAFKGWDVRHIRFLLVPFPASDGWPGHYLRASRKYAAAVFDAVEGALKGYDLVYAQGFSGLAFIHARQGGKHRVPVVVNLHGYEMFQKAPSWPARLSRGPLQAMAREVSRGADAVFSFGGHITGILSSMGIPAERILECPIGIEEKWLINEVPERGGGDGRAFVFVGRDERRKGVRELNMALKALSAMQLPQWRMHFVGPVRERHRVQFPNVVYHGLVGREEQVMALLRAADILVCPSFSEGMPTVIMEAMASGLAIVATDVGAVSRQVGGNGWLLPGPAPEAIRSAMQQGASMAPAELLAMKQRSLEKVRDQFTWENVIVRKLQLLASVMEGKTGIA